MPRHRVFSSNTEISMSDHIAWVRQNAKQGKYILQPISSVGVPRNLLDAATSYIVMPEPAKNECQIQRIQLYPYGSYFPIVNYNRFLPI